MVVIARPDGLREARGVVIPATLFAAVTAVAFVIVRPPVGDIFAARARQSAALHGVGERYWFSWFGGIVPGHYSVLGPLLSAHIECLRSRRSDNRGHRCPVLGPGARVPASGPGDLAGRRRRRLESVERARAIRSRHRRYVDWLSCRYDMDDP